MKKQVATCIMLGCMLFFALPRFIIAHTSIGFGILFLIVYVMFINPLFFVITSAKFSQNIRKLYWYPAFMAGMFFISMVTSFKTYEGIFYGIIYMIFGYIFMILGHIMKINNQKRQNAFKVSMKDIEYI